MRSFICLFLLFVTSPLFAAGNLVLSPPLSTLVKTSCVTPFEFGAKGDGSTDDNVALTAWLNLINNAPAQAAPCLHLPVGRFRSSIDLNLTMAANSHGPYIWGNGGDNSAIVFDPGHHFTMQSSTAMFYSSLHDFGIVGNFAGPLVKFSLSTTDALNGAEIEGLVVNNSSTNSANMGIQFNAVYNSRIMATANCSGHTNTIAGNGIGIQFVAGTMNSIKTSTGSCHIGLNLSSTSNALAGNTFDGIDSEVNDIQLQMSGASTQTNIFVGGILSYLYSGDVGVVGVSGQGNILKQFAYGGSGTLFGNTKVGIIWENTAQDLVYPGPTVPASGTPAINNYGQPADVNISGGTITSITTAGLTVCSATPCHTIVMPGDNLVWNGSSAPVWWWRAIQH